MLEKENKSNFFTDNFSSLLGAAASITGDILNYKSTEKTNEANQKINQNNIDYQTAMTQKQWERDDNAHQREVADLQAAGLSPLAATNGAENSAALGAPNPIAMQAPQVNSTALLNAFLQNKALNENKRHNLVQEGQKNTELSLQADEIELKAEELEIENKKVRNTILYNAKYIKYLNDQLTETSTHNRTEESLKKLQYKSEEYFKSIQAQTRGKFNYKVYTDLGSYEAALTTWTTQFNNFINTLQETSKSESSSSSGNFNVGANAGASVTGTGGQGGINFGKASSGSESSGSNISQKQQAKMDKWYSDHPMPVYHRSIFD